MIWLLVAQLAAAETVQPDLTDPAVRMDTQVEVLEALLDAQMSEQALAMVSEMRKSGASDVRLDVAQARAMHQRGLDTDATSLLRAVVKKHPRDHAAWGQLGVVLADGGKVPEAIEALQKAVRLAPKNADYQNNLGFALMAGGQNEAAVTAFRAALAIDPASARTRTNLGFALVRLELYSEALEAFRATYDEGDARYNLGVACEQAGESTVAITNYQAAIAARPGHTLAVPALSRLLKEASP